ncbi:UNVERIFIED_CONTAM: AraC-like DNA-binding protein [Acetivibrio alkalicellulosi]
MNYYERIQKSIDYIESQLNASIEIEKAAQEAYMSCSSYYRMFFALTGYAVKEYIRQRRISSAVKEIKKTNDSILDIAIRHDFESNEAFTRACKRITGYPPSAFRKHDVKYSFERVNVLDKFIDAQDNDLIEKYPDIKVLKNLEPMRVAYYCYYGREPENGAFSVISDWFRRSGMNIEKDKMRIFGFNNPNPSPGQDEYGYEVWVTIADNIEVNDSLIKTKIVEGGLYVVCGVRDLVGGDGAEISSTWKRFSQWISESKYVIADHQWLEEHLNFNDEFEHTGGMDLYMPIAPKAAITDQEKEIVNVEPMKTVAITFNGENAYDEALGYMYEFVMANGYHMNTGKRRTFCYYNHERAGKNDFWVKVHITVDDSFTTNNKKLNTEIFQGGLYAYEEVEWINNGKRWYQFIDWVKMSKKYDFDNRPFIEEFIIDGPGKLRPSSRVKHFMPIRNCPETSEFL